MKERGVTRPDIEITVEHPDDTFRTNDDSICHRRTFTDGRTLRVMVREPIIGNRRDVRTALWEDKG